MNRYFAYGSNMDTDQMARRCPGAVLAGVAALPDHRFQITSQGFGTIIAHPAAVVYGVVWRLTEDDERALDEYEGVAEGSYRKVEKKVKRQAPTDTVQVLVYLATESTTGKPIPGYMERVVRAAREHRLPAAYVAELESWLAGAAGGA